MTTPHLSFIEAETSEELGTKTEFTIYPWGITISVQVTDGERVETNFALIQPEQALLLRDFLNRHLEG